VRPSTTRYMYALYLYTICTYYMYILHYFFPFSLYILYNNFIRKSKFDYCKILAWHHLSLIGTIYPLSTLFHCQYASPILGRHYQLVHYITYYGTYNMYVKCVHCAKRPIHIYMYTFPYPSFPFPFFVIPFPFPSFFLLSPILSPFPLYIYI
jgi:hypothetical protein